MNCVYYIKINWKKGQWEIPDSFIIISKNIKQAKDMLLDLGYMNDFQEIKSIQRLGTSELSSQIITMNYIFW
jgi:hypothetical protein